MLKCSKQYHPHLTITDCADKPKKKKVFFFPEVARPIFRHVGIPLPHFPEYGFDILIFSGR